MNPEEPHPLQYCIVEYAGQQGAAGLEIGNGSPAIRNCTIRRNAGDGIRITLYAGNPSVSQCNIYDNKPYNYNNQMTKQAVARSNWWGSAQGAQLVNGSVDTSGFLTTPVLVGSPRSPLMLFFPHFAAGGGWKSLLFLKNLESVSSTVEIVFLDDAGNPKNVSVDGVTGNAPKVDIAAGGSRVVEMSGSKLNAGWMELLPTQKVSASLVFQLVSENRVISSAGVVPSELGQAFVVSFAASRALDSALGFAISNPNKDAIKVTCGLFRSSGTRESDKTIDLAGRGHSALFVNELFSQASDWNGFIQLSSDLGFCLTPLRFDGEVISTIPAIRIR